MLVSYSSSGAAGTDVARIYALFFCVVVFMLSVPMAVVYCYAGSVACVCGSRVAVLLLVSVVVVVVVAAAAVWQW